jgi:hypothetical protein
MTAAIGQVPGLERRRCRAAAEQSFSIDRMARDHVRLYRRVLSGRYRLADPRYAAPGAGPQQLARRASA